MNWDEIEYKWIAMIHRVRSDWQVQSQATPGANDIRITKKAIEVTLPVSLPAEQAVPEAARRPIRDV